MRDPRQRGFTVIELLVVIAILGILATIAIPKYRASKDKAKLASVKIDLRNLRTAQEAYFNGAGRYTNSLAATLFSPSPGNTVRIAAPNRVPASYTATVTNASIAGTPKRCRVTVGNTAANSGVVICT